MTLSDPALSLPRHLFRKRLAIAGAVLAALALAASAALTFGPHLGDLASFKSIGLNYDALRQGVAANTPLAVAMYVGGYTLMGLLFIPGSPVVVVAGGLLFGAALGFPVSLVASTLAATMGFMLARTVANLSGGLSHPALDRLRAGFHRHELSYMMFLRLTPGLPFTGINLCSALLGVTPAKFIIGSALGLLPSRIALSTAGAGLGSAIAAQNLQYSQCVALQTAEAAPCAYDINLASLLTWEMLAAFVALALLALVPVLMDAVPAAWRFAVPRQPIAADAQREIDYADEKSA